MRYELLARPASSVVKVYMNAGEHLTCEVVRWWHVHQRPLKRPRKRRVQVAVVS